MALSPANHIVFYVCGNAVQFAGVANDVIVEPCLPCKRNVLFVGKSGYGLFELPDNNGQPRLHLCCNLNGVPHLLLLSFLL